MFLLPHDVVTRYRTVVYVELRCRLVGCVVNVVPVGLLADPGRLVKSIKSGCLHANRYYTVTTKD